MQNIKYSNLKMFWHPDKIKAIKDGIISAPLYIRIKPTNKCNHKCFYCSYQHDKRLVTTENIDVNDMIPQEKMMEILSDMYQLGVKAVTYSGGGEPLIYPYIKETLQKTVDYSIDLSIITNGQMLKGEIAQLLVNAKWVRISLESATSETFKKIRMVPEKLFNELVNNIGVFSTIKNKNCEFGINFVINHENFSEIYQSAKLFQSLGVNHIKYTARNTPDFHDYHAPFKKEALRQIEAATKEFTRDTFSVHDAYSGDFVYAGVYERNYSFCPIVQCVTVIGADCKVYLCHDKTYSGAGIVGDISEQSFENMWLSEDTKERLQKLDVKKSCNHHCTYDQRNILINEVVECANDHVNFV